MLRHLILLTIFALSTTSLFGCIPPHLNPLTRYQNNYSDFTMVEAGPNDSFTSLAQKYYNDPYLAEYIAEHNNLTSIKTGERLVIPKTPVITAGVSKKQIQTVTILCYHNLSSRNQGGITVSKESFAAQMNFLKENGFTVIDMDRFYDFLDHKTILPAKSVVITIDDGWRSAYENAFPILRQYNFPATLFVYTDLITNTKMTLSWAMIREMASNGIAIENHSKSHLNYAKIPEGMSLVEYFETIKSDLLASSDKIKEKTGQEVKYFAYPYGETNSLIIGLLKKAGYRGALTATRGGNPFFTDNFQVNRTAVQGNYDLKKFGEIVETSSRRWLK